MLYFRNIIEFIYWLNYFISIGIIHRNSWEIFFIFYEVYSLKDLVLFIIIYCHYFNLTREREGK